MGEHSPQTYAARPAGQPAAAIASAQGLRAQKADQLEFTEDVPGEPEQLLAAVPAGLEPEDRLHAERLLAGVALAGDPDVAARLAAVEVPDEA